MALTNAERQARHRAKRAAVVPTIYDVSLDERRAVTQDDVDMLVKRCSDYHNLRCAILAALGLPQNAADQVARLKALGGMYGTLKLLKGAADGR